VRSEWKSDMLPLHYTCKSVSYRIRTYDPQLRRLMLYPTELRTHCLVFQSLPSFQDVIHNTAALRLIDLSAFSDVTHQSACESRLVGPVGLEPTCTITLSAPYKSEGIRAQNFLFFKEVIKLCVNVSSALLMVLI
jgi:hypothetical protein